MRGTCRLALALVVLRCSPNGVDSFVGPIVHNVVLGGTMKSSTSSKHERRLISCRRLTERVGSGRRMRKSAVSVLAMSAAIEIDPFPYTEVLPFLAEHVQPSDQMLILGCGTELPLQLSRDGYGTRDNRSFVRCVDSDPEKIATIKAAADGDPVCAENMANGRLVFEVVDVASGIPELEQSTIDCVVDAGLLDHLITTQGLDTAKRCLDAAHRAVRLGNPLVALSKIDKSQFAAVFDGNWGWMQELDGDPGAISQWYRNKGHGSLKDVKNNFEQLGIAFFVYTNVDNC